MDDYKKIITELVQKQMSMVGPSVALSIVQKVPVVKVADNGEVLEVNGDPKAALESVANAYIAFSGEISRMILKSVMGKMGV